MKLQIKHIILLLPFIFIATGCTRNNGDIGKWFGKWQLQELTINGTSAPEVDEGRFFWDFQNDIIRIDRINDNVHEVSYCIGTWSQPSPDTMVFDFTHTSDNNYFLTPFEEMHFPSDEPFLLTIVSQSGKECIMKRIDESTGTEYLYHLRKR